MVRRRRYLFMGEILASRDETYLPQWQTQIATCPEAARISDEEAQDFAAAVIYFDDADVDRIQKTLRRAHITYPPELTFDPYRLARYVFHRWSDPAVRSSFFAGQMLDYGYLARIQRMSPAEMHAGVDRWGLPLLVSIFRRHGLEHLIEPSVRSLTPAQLARNQGLLLAAKVTMHRLMTEPLPGRQPSPWEQRALSRRIQLREVQMRSMRRSLYRLRRERKALLGRLRDSSRVQNGPELDELAAELARLRAVRADAERDHAAELADQSARFQELITRLQAEVTAARRDYSETLALRRSWLPVQQEGKP